MRPLLQNEADADASLVFQNHDQTKMNDHEFSLCEIHENDSVLKNHIKAGHLTSSRNPSCSSIIAATKRDTRAVTSQILASLHAEVPRELNRGSHYHTRFQFSKGDFVFAFKISSFNLLLRSGTPQNATRAPSQFTLLLIQPYLNVFDRALDRPFFPPQIQIISPPTETHHMTPSPDIHEFGVYSSSDSVCSCYLFWERRFIKL